jgi:invasion protein IalB
VAQIAVGRTARNEPLRMTVLLPTNVSFPSSVRISGDENDTSPVDLPWRRCIPGACIADNTIADPALQRLRARTTTGRITFKDALGRDVTLPISLRGLAQGLDALAREQ